MTPEERREYNRRYYANNRERICAQKREWYAEHPEARARQAVTHRNWQKKNAAHVAEYQKIWRLSK